MEAFALAELFTLGILNGILKDQADYNLFFLCSKFAKEVECSCFQTLGEFAYLRTLTGVISGLFQNGSVTLYLLCNLVASVSKIDLSLIIPMAQC